jgi:hypothetical protein
VKKLIALALVVALVWFGYGYAKTLYGGVQVDNAEAFAASTFLVIAQTAQENSFAHGPVVNLPELQRLLATPPGTMCSAVAAAGCFKPPIRVANSARVHGAFRISATVVWEGVTYSTVECLIRPSLKGQFAPLPQSGSGARTSQGPC